jgi:serine/threonine protein phosphatase PrpC
VVRSGTFTDASADEACQLLLAAALKNGGKDNVTIVLARYRIQQ